MIIKTRKSLVLYRKLKNTVIMLHSELFIMCGTLIIVQLILFFKIIVSDKQIVSNFRMAPPSRITWAIS